MDMPKYRYAKIICQNVDNNSNWLGAKNVIAKILTVDWYGAKIEVRQEGICTDT
jgi:hypothetical protein